MFSPSRHFFFPFPPVLWPRLTSHDKLYSASLNLPTSASVRSPRVSAITFIPCSRLIYRVGFGQYWTSLCVASSSAPVRPFYEVSVRRLGTLPSASFRFRLATDTLAVQLEVPTAMPSVVFHHLVIAHAGRTTKKGGAQDRPLSCAPPLRHPGGRWGSVKINSPWIDCQPNAGPHSALTCSFC